MVYKGTAREFVVPAGGARRRAARRRGGEASRRREARRWGERGAYGGGAMSDVRPARRLPATSLAGGARRPAQPARPRPLAVTPLTPHSLHRIAPNNS